MTARASATAVADVGVRQDDQLRTKGLANGADSCKVIFRVIAQAKLDRLVARVQMLLRFFYQLGRILEAQ